MKAVQIKTCNYFLLAATTDWTSLYARPDEFELVDDNLLTTLPILPKEWRVSFDLKPTRMENNSTDWNNIFQMHVQGSNWPEVGCKIPEVQFNLENKLAIYSAINCETVNLGSDKMPTPVLDTWTSIKIIQKQEKDDGAYSNKVLIDEELLYRTDNSQPQIFENVEVFASKSLSSGYSGLVKNLKIDGRGTSLQGKTQSGQATFQYVKQSAT